MIFWIIFSVVAHLKVASPSAVTNCNQTIPHAKIVKIHCRCIAESENFCIKYLKKFKKKPNLYENMAQSGCLWLENISDKSL